MRVLRLLAGLWALSLIASSASVMAARDPAQGGTGASHPPGSDRRDANETGPDGTARDGSDRAVPGDRGESADRGQSGDRGESGDHGDREHRAAEASLRNLSEARRGEREDFQDHVEAARDACQDLSGADRGLCMANVSDLRRAFETRARENFESARDALLQRSPPERLGGFSVENGTWTGRFVSFSWDATNVTVKDYTVGGVLVFDRIQGIGGADGSASLAEAGRTARLQGGGSVNLMIHDNPGGVLTARAADGTRLAFTLNPALTSQTSPSGLALAGPGNFTAVLHAERLTTDNATANATGAVTFVAHEGNVALPKVANGHRDEIEQAKGRGQVGAEVTVAGPDERDTESAVLDDALHVDVTRPAEGGVRVVVNATGLGPRTIVLNVAAEVLRGDRVNVTYFDEANGTFRSVPIVRADSLADVLDPTDDSTPEYWIVRDADGVQVLVSVPHFSTHAFEVSSFGLPVDVPPSVLGGAFAGVLFVAVAGAGLWRKKRA